MSAANIVVQGAKAHLLTDSGFFWDDGRLATLGSKVVEMAGVRAAVSTRGSLLPEALAREINHANPASLADLIGRLAEIFSAAVTIYTKAGASSSLFMVYHSLETGRAGGIYMGSCTFGMPDWYKPFTPLPITEMFAPGLDATEALGRSVDVSDPSTFDAERDGLALVTRQRATPWRLFGKGNEAIRVGGEVRLTTVSADGLETRVIGGWSDRVGERIRGRVGG